MVAEKKERRKNVRRQNLPILHLKIFNIKSYILIFKTYKYAYHNGLKLVWKTEH